MNPLSRISVSHQRRGAVAPLVAVMSTVLLGFVALAIDMGLLYNTRAELQRAADAAALAGASGYHTNLGLVQDNVDELTQFVKYRSWSIAKLNRTLGDPTILEANDITLGTIDSEDPDLTLDTSGSRRLNAVHVIARRTEDSPGGPVGLFFARLFGVAESDVSASATAIAHDGFAGLRLVSMDGINLMPFTINADLYEAMVVGGTDEFGYWDGVKEFGDGVHEIVLYPHKIKDTGSDDGSELPLDTDGGGNFGTLNIGLENQGSSYVSDQILNGVTPDELEAEIGSQDLLFYDDNGGALTHDVTGNTGMSASIEAALETRIGDIIAFFVHDNATDNGSGTTFTTTGIRVARVMHVDLSGSPDSKRLVVQPTSYMGPGIIVDDQAPSTYGQVGRVYLVK